MALNFDKFVMVCTLTDTQGQKSSRSFDLVAVDAVAAAIAAGTIAAGILGITDDVLSSYSINHVFSEDAFVFPVGADNTQKVNMSWEIPNDRRAHSSMLAPKTSLFLTATGPGNIELDLTNVAVIAWNDAITINTTISDGEIPSALLSGKRN